MNPPGNPTHKPKASSRTPWKSRRRVIDATGLALFHVAFLGLLAASDSKLASTVPILAVPILGLDVIYFLSPPKRKPILDDKPDPNKPVQKPGFWPYALEYFVLLAPPVMMIAWFLSVIWAHRTLTRQELIALLVALPVVVGVVSWIIYLRMTRTHAGAKNNYTQFIALAMLAMWIGSTFLFFLLAGCFFFKHLQP